MTHPPDDLNKIAHLVSMYLKRLEQIKRQAELRRSYQEGIDMCNAEIMALSEEMNQLEELLHLKPIVFWRE